MWLFFRLCEVDIPINTSKWSTPGPGVGVGRVGVSESGCAGLIMKSYFTMVRRLSLPLTTM